MRCPQLQRGKAATRPPLAKPRESEAGGTQTAPACSVARVYAAGRPAATLFGRCLTPSIKEIIGCPRVVRSGQRNLLRHPRRSKSLFAGLDGARELSAARPAGNPCSYSRTTARLRVLPLYASGDPRKRKPAVTGQDGRVRRRSPRRGRPLVSARPPRARADAASSPDLLPLCDPMQPRPRSGPRPSQHHARHSSARPENFPRRRRAGRPRAWCPNSTEHPVAVGAKTCGTLFAGLGSRADLKNRRTL